MDNFSRLLKRMIESAEKTIKKSADYGDDIRDYEKKENAKWIKALQNNPYYRGYR